MDVVLENGANLALADINEKDANELLREFGDDRFVVPFTIKQCTKIDFTAGSFSAKSTW